MNKEIFCGNYNINRYGLTKFAIYDILTHKRYIITQEEYKSLCKEYEGDWQPICSRIDQFVKEME